MYVIQRILNRDYRLPVIAMYVQKIEEINLLLVRMKSILSCLLLLCLTKNFEASVGGSNGHKNMLVLVAFKRIYTENLAKTKWVKESLLKLKIFNLQKISYESKVDSTIDDITKQFFNIGKDVI